MTMFYLSVYCVLLLCLCYFTFSLATDYQKNETRNHTFFVLWIIDTIDLFIHETGHLIFGIFGRFVGFLGGSLFQVIIPIAAVIVFAHSSIWSLAFTLYWTGQSLVNVSVYIGDAPYRKLHLISRYAIHDWWWILNSTGMMEYSADFAGGANLLGLLTCTAGIGIGFSLVIRESIRLSSSNKNSLS